MSMLTVFYLVVLVVGLLLLALSLRYGPADPLGCPSHWSLAGLIGGVIVIICASGLLYAALDRTLTWLPTHRWVL